MRRHVVVAAAVLVLAGSSFAVAQQFRGHEGRDGRGGGMHGGMQRWQPTAEDIEAFTDARVAGMKAGLRLNADQEKNWPAFEQAYRGLAKQRAARIAERRDEPRGGDRAGDIVQFMQRRADIMTQRAAGFKQLADAAAPLYQSLDDAQKRRFSMLARMLRPRPMMGERGHHMRPGGPGRFHDRGGYDRPRFGEGGGMMQHGDLRTGGNDDEEMDLAQERAEELEFANLGRLPAQPPAR
jgi:zinc resistance-associated protein